MTQHKKYIIIGAGISGLTIATALQDTGVTREDLLVIEANKEIGGLIKTDTVEGYTTEWGPEGLRGKSEHTQWVVDHLDREIIPVSEESKIRYIGRDDDLIKTPTGPGSAIFSKLLPFTGKLRLLKEPFVGTVEEDETIAEFIDRRLGKHVVPLVDAFVTGVFGGDPHRLSTEHSFPIMKELEREYGSLIRGGMKHSKKKKAEQDDGKLGNSDEDDKPPFLVTTRDGMQGIVDGLAKGTDINLDQPVTKISKTDDGYEIETPGAIYTTDNLVIAIGVNALKQIDFEGFNLDDKPETEEAIVSVVTLGFDEAAFEDEVKGYGFLIPDKEERFIMGTLFSSRLFDFRAPSDKVMLRSFVGGIRHPNRVELPEDEIISSVLEDLDDYLGLKQKPEFTRLQSFKPRGIPQLNLGHEDIKNWRETMEAKHQNLKFAGIGWSAISCDKLIAEGRQIADSLTAMKN